MLLLMKKVNRVIVKFKNFFFGPCLIVFGVLCYFVELFIVFPGLYEIGSYWYAHHFLLATFVFMNAISNYGATIIVDTSIKKYKTCGIQYNWHNCPLCKQMVPPKAVHCKSCNSCILKYDHHSILTSCCIGQYNFRYFLMFLFYAALGLCYATYYNYWFIKPVLEPITWIKLLLIVYPITMVYLAISSGDVMAMVSAVILVVAAHAFIFASFYATTMFNGSALGENHSYMKFRSKSMKDKIVDALGKKWYLVWISPIVKSAVRDE